MSRPLTGARYIALGSSMAAGPGISPRAPGSPRRAARSAGNYPHLVALALDHHLTDLTYSGATTANILSESRFGTAPQITAVDADRLASNTAAAAAETGCELVGAAAASRDHHAWSAQPWTVGAGFPLSFRYWQAGAVPSQRRGHARGRGPGGRAPASELARAR